MKSKTQKPLLLEFAAAILVPAALLGFIRVFEDPKAIFPVIATTFLSTLLAAVFRRLGLPLILSLLVSFTTLVFIIVFQFAREAGAGSIIDQLQMLANDLVEDFKQQTTPVPAADPFIAATMIVGWLMAFLTDWGALRLKLAFEPVLPAALIFIFASIPPINAEENQVAATLIFGFAVAVWGIAQRYSRISAQSLSISVNNKHSKFVAATGLTLALIAVMTGGFLGHRLPLAGAEAKFTLPTTPKTDDVRNPYVDLGARLGERSDDSAFSVIADRPAYWRMVGLNEYSTRNANDDFATIWAIRIGGKNTKESRYSQPKNIPGEELTQQFEIKSLGIPEEQDDGTIEIEKNVWVPAALTPKEVDNDDINDIDDITQTLTVDVAKGTADLEYEVVSEVPNYTADQLRSAAENLQPEYNSSDVNLLLPSEATEIDGYQQRNIPPIVEQTALEVTAGLDNRYDQMIALQNYFQTFEYELNIPKYDGKDEMEQFLENRTGFCQQFSGTFAVMARQLGVPSRVAVGFTWGDEVIAEDGSVSYDVKGKHAHAWPEIYFGEELGWVPFEPTPGRGLPEASDYTGLPADQDSDTPEPTPEDTDEEEPEELETEEAPAPIPEKIENPDLTIGNYLWSDDNENGQQDASEAPLQGVTVTIYDTEQTLVGSAKTNDEGAYLFGVNKNSEYVLRVDNPTDYEPDGPLYEKGITLSLTGDPETDSNGIIAEDGFPEATVMSGESQENDESVDFGFLPKKAIAFSTFDLTNEKGFFAPLKSLPWKWIGTGTLLLSYPLLVPLFYSLRRKHRWQKIGQLLSTNTTPSLAEATKLSWVQADEIIHQGFDIRRSTSETITEYTQRLSKNKVLESTPMTNLAEALTACSYNPQGTHLEQASLAHAESLSIEKRVKSSVRFYTLYMQMLKPRNLFSYSGKSKQAATGLSFSSS